MKSSQMLSAVLLSVFALYPIKVQGNDRVAGDASAQDQAKQTKKPKQPPAKKPTQNRPTLNIAQGTTVAFADYKKFNGKVYGPDGKVQIQDLNAAWANVSDLVIDGTLEVTRTDPKVRVSEVLVVNNLTIKPTGRIVTNGNVLLVFANSFQVQTDPPKNIPGILSFVGTNVKATPASAQNGRGADGNAPGANGGTGPQGIQGPTGESGGAIHIFASNYGGLLYITLKGQDGGDGGQGGAGGNGAQGAHGGDAETDPSGVFCRHDGDNGGQGGAQGAGGLGGPAGQGGDGGVVSFFFVTSADVSATNPKIIVDAGSSGQKGPGGPSGNYGPGGIGGSGRDGCHGGIQGPHGVEVASLGPGPDAAQGVKGSSTVLQLAALTKIEDAFKKATSPREVEKPLSELGTAITIQ